MNESIKVDSKTLSLARQYFQLSKQQQASFSQEILNPREYELDGEQSENSKERFIIRNASFALEPQPPVDWILQNLISAGSLNVIVGEPGCGKTYLMISLGVCIALGKAWLGLSTKQGRVLFVDEESGERRLARRLGEVLRGEFGDESTPFNFISLARFKFEHEEDCILLSTLIEENTYSLVVIDALADVMDGDENSKEETQPLLSALRRVAETTNAAIVVIHHTNKMGGYRGSSAIKASADLMLFVKSDGDDGEVTLEVQKSRDAEPIKLSAELTWNDGQFWVEGRTKEDSLCVEEQYVIDYLKEKGESYVPDIIKDPQACTPERARKAIYRLARKNRIKRKNPDETGIGVKAKYDLI
jgi:archaellum biogenesis ATPase FlaH